MPTGYTAELCEKEVPFEKFVWGCARAFGAFVMQRDDDSDAPLVMEEQVSDYHAKAFAEAGANLERVRAMKPSDVLLAHAAYVEKVVRENRESEARKVPLRNRLNGMLAKVVRWEPPTKVHAGLKDFMIEQLRSTIDSDGTAYVQTVIADPGEWHRTNMGSAERSVAYHEKQMREEIMRVKGRNDWKLQLLKSVPLPK